MDPVILFIPWSVCKCVCLCLLLSILLCCLLCLCQQHSGCRVLLAMEMLEVRAAFRLPKLFGDLGKDEGSHLDGIWRTPSGATREGETWGTNLQLGRCWFCQSCCQYAESPCDLQASIFSGDFCWCWSSAMCLESPNQVDLFC